jgi:hypothetical protein
MLNPASFCRKLLLFPVRRIIYCRDDTDFQHQDNGGNKENPPGEGAGPANPVPSLQHLQAVCPHTAFFSFLSGGRHD